MSDEEVSDNRSNDVIINSIIDGQNVEESHQTILEIEIKSEDEEDVVSDENRAEEEVINAIDIIPRDIPISGHSEDNLTNSGSQTSAEEFGENCVETAEENVTKRQEEMESTQIESNDQNIELNDNSFQSYDRIVGNDSQSEDKKSYTVSLVCDVEGCVYKSGNKSQLKKHKQRMHRKNKPIICSLEECNKEFKTQTDSTNHQKNCHKPIDNNSIEILVEQTVQMSETSNQSNEQNCVKTQENCENIEENNEMNLSSVETNDQIVREDIQIESTETVCQSKIQRKNGTKREYVCTFDGCTAIFKGYNSWLSHKNIHKGKYKCDFEGCLYKAGDKTRLRIHERRHLTPFKCSLKDC